MRPDKVTMAGVALTIGLYRAGRATTDIPVWQMIGVPTKALRERAERLRARLGDGVEVVELRSTIGGGSLPGESLPSVGLALGNAPATPILAALRHADPPVIGRIEDGRVVLDLRTVDPRLDDELVSGVELAMGGNA